MDCVLQHVFDFQRNYLLKDMFQVHKAHITMLTEENLMKKEEAKVILHALKGRGNSRRAIALYRAT